MNENLIKQMEMLRHISELNRIQVLRDKYEKTKLEQAKRLLKKQIDTLEAKYKK